MGKKFYNENLFLLKKTFFTEININENVNNIYLISKMRQIFTQKMFVLQIKYKSFLNMRFLIIKNIFVKTSLRTQ